MLINRNWQIPNWAIPLTKPSRYKGAKGGRASGKSHFFAEMAVMRLVEDKNLPIVCIREIQRSLKFSAKILIENKIRKFGVEDLFHVTNNEIKRRGHNAEGVMIFQGMQDHTADSVKSLEGFKVAWVEEGQRLSAKSLRLLRPTIRAPGSEIWASWNPDQPTDPIDEFFASQPKGSTLVHVNYDQNPFLPEDIILEEVALDQANDPDAYNHIWLGGYNTKSDSQVFGGKWCIDEFEPQEHWDGPYYGGDWGFSADPTALVKFWIDDVANIIYIEREAYGVRCDLDDTPELFRSIMHDDKWPIRADSARPETISFMNKRGFNITGAEKWAGSIEDGIAYLRSFKTIVIHERCKKTQEEARLYKHKIDRLTEEILPDIVDKHNHIWDAVRYALEPIVKMNLSRISKAQMKQTENMPAQNIAPTMESEEW